MKVANAVLAHQAGGLLRDAQPVALYSIMRMDAVMFASRHGVLLIVR
jgi:hypothetical protein